MKKKLALLSVLGAAGGLLYALESQRRRNKTTAVRSSRVETDNSETSVAGPGGNGTAKPAASMAKIEEGQPQIGEKNDHIVDDQGTDQGEASRILTSIRDTAFDGSSEKLALALGRPIEEIESWANGAGLIDGDVVMKARTLAMQRGFEI